MKYSFLKEVDNKAIFTGNSMECYIPVSLFEKGLATVVSGVVSALGTFNLKVAINPKDNIANSKVYTFGVPTKVQMRPTEIEKRNLVTLHKGSKAEDYMVLKFFSGDELLTSMDVVQSVDNVNDFMMKLMVEGKLPPTIPYGEGFELFLKNLELNKINLNTSASTLSVIYSESYRYKDDASIPFRKVIATGKCSELDYITANIRSICANSSSFAALTFEDQDAMIIKSVNRKRLGYNNGYSPVEKLIKESFNIGNNHDNEDDLL